MKDILAIAVAVKPRSVLNNSNMARDTIQGIGAGEFPGGSLDICGRIRDVSVAGEALKTLDRESVFDVLEKVVRVNRTRGSDCRSDSGSGVGRRPKRGVVGRTDGSVDERPSSRVDGGPGSSVGGGPKGVGLSCGHSVVVIDGKPNISMSDVSRAYGR